MLIGIVSDTHGNHTNVRRALEILRARGVELVLHCGDVDDAGTVALFAGTRTHFVQGNCDMDGRGIALAARLIGSDFHGRFAELELEGKHIAVIHGDDQQRMQLAIAAGRFDYLFYGHTHQMEQHREGHTRVVNPGALHRARPKTFAMLDLQTDELEVVPLEE